MPHDTCAECAAPLVDQRRDARYCSRRCKARAHKKRSRDPIPVALACTECGAIFGPVSPTQRFCSPKCRYANRDGRPEVRERDNARHRAQYVPTGKPRGAPRTQPLICVAEGCARAPLALSLCQRHYRAKRYADGTPWAQGGDYKRRARQHGVEYEPINRLVVFRRDGWVCGICGDPVAREDASLDHVIPMSLGGPHLYSNVQCSHLLCNIRKAATLPEAVVTP